MKKAKKKAAAKKSVVKKKSADKPVYTMKKKVKGDLRQSKLQRSNPDLWNDVSNMEIWDTITFPNSIKNIVTNFRKILEQKGWKFEMIKQNANETVMRRLSTRTAPITVKGKTKKAE